MDEKYKQFVADLAAFMRFAREHNKPDAWTLFNLSHDIEGVDIHGLSSFFSPRCTGYAHREEGQRITLERDLGDMRAISTDD